MTANAGVSGSSGRLVFSSGSANGGNSGAILIGSGTATGGSGGLVSISAGSGTSGIGGAVYISGGASVGTGGNVEIKAGASTGGTTGSTYVKNPTNGAATLTISATTFLVDTGTVTISASSTITVDAGTTLTLDGGSNGVTFDSSYVYGFEYDSGTVSSSAVTLNTMTGKITSDSSDLVPSGSSQTITLTNSRIVTTSLVFVNVKTTCTGGHIVAVSSNPGGSGGSATIVVYNAGQGACTNAYSLSFVVIN